MSKLERAVALSERLPWMFTIQYPPKREYFQANFRCEDRLDECLTTAPDLLYVHVPFCERKCFYCNFAVDTRHEESLYARYVDGILCQLADLDRRSPLPRQVRGIDVGGGTPTRLPAAQLERLLGALRPWTNAANHPFALSVETTPTIAASEPEKLRILKEGGVERVSMGVQSTGASVLNEVNRSANGHELARAVEHLQRGCFHRLNADLIFGLPGQSLAQWLEDLRRVVGLGFDSITTYDCLYRGKGRIMNRHRPEVPSPQRYGELYDAAYAYLVSEGFHAAYGSVNFSRHAGETGTSAYFEGRLLDGRAYLGIGNYASSLLGDRWFFAPYSVRAWASAVAGGTPFPCADRYQLPLLENAAKYLLLSMNFGIIDPLRFERRFGVALSKTHGAELEFAQERGWLQRRADGCYGLTPGHFSALPQVRSLLYSTSALSWMDDQVRAAPSA